MEEAERRARTMGSRFGVCVCDSISVSTAVLRGQREVDGSLGL